jgi:hypothetical protein
MSSRVKGRLGGCRYSARLDCTFEPNVGLATGRFGFSLKSGSDVAGPMRFSGAVQQRRGLAAPCVVAGKAGKPRRSFVAHGGSCC